MALTRRQQRFVEEYLIDLNGAAAARRVGYSAASARNSAWRMLKRPAVRAALEAELARRRAAARITVDAVLGELARVAFFDPAGLVDAAGEPLALSAMDRDTRAGLGHIDMLEREAGPRAAAARHVKARAGEKVRALIALKRFLEDGYEAERLRAWEEAMRAKGFAVSGGVARMGWG